jgi:hypothetical protein
MNDHPDAKNTPDNASQPSAVGTAPSRRGWFRGRGAPQVGDAAPARQLEEALAELVLLREENARLSAAVHEPPSLGRLVNRVRSLGSAAQAGSDDCADDAAQMLVEGVVLRDSLLEACQEIERSMTVAKTRLNGMDAEPQSLVLLASGHDDGGFAERVFEDSMGVQVGAR